MPTGCNLFFRGLTVDRPDLIVWTVTGVLAFSVGRRSPWSVIVDWLPFAALLMAYDFSRGAAHLLGRPTLWTPQITVDRWLGFGHEPTIWLQEHLKESSVPWWEFLVSTTYVSYFLLPYVVAGVLWLRNRHVWRRFVVRYVLLSFVGITGFIIFPAAPPWAAAKCTAADVVHHPSNPACLYEQVRPAGNGLLGGYLHLSHPSASPYVEQLALRGFLRHGLPIAAKAISEGHADANQVAAIPSLHAATSLLDRRVPVAAGPPPVAPAAGRLPAGDGVQPGLLGRALRRRHPARLGDDGGPDGRRAHAGSAGVQPGRPADDGSRFAARIG